MSEEMQEDFIGFYARKADAEMYAAFYRERGLDAKVVGQAGNWRIRLWRPVAFLPDDAFGDKTKYVHPPIIRGET